MTQPWPRGALDRIAATQPPGSHPAAPRPFAPAIQFARRAATHSLDSQAASRTASFFSFGPEMLGAEVFGKGGWLVATIHGAQRAGARAAPIAL